MPTDKVKEFIKKLGAPKLTKAQVAIIKDHHEYHGDKKSKSSVRYRAVAFLSGVSVIWDIWIP